MYSQDSSRTRIWLIWALIGIVVVFLFSIFFFYLLAGNKTPPTTAAIAGTQHASTATPIAILSHSPTATPTPIPPTIANAGFETPTLGTSYQYNIAGNAWKFSGLAGSGSGITGNQSGFTSSNPNAPEGTQVAFIQAMGSISQTIHFVDAGRYIVSFQAAQRVQFQHGGEDFEVLIDNTVVGNFFPADTTYAIFTTPIFPVTTGDHVLTFQGIDSKGGDNTVFIDAIKMIFA